MANCIDLPERDRLANLLGRLRACDSLDDVPLALLAEPQCDTRPSVKLVAHYRKCRLMIRGEFSVIAVVKALPWGFTAVFLSWLLAVSTKLKAWLLSVITAPWMAQVALWLLDPVAATIAGMVSGAVLFLYAVTVRMERLSFPKGDLILDLNELCHAAASEQTSVPWRGVYTATRCGNRRVRVTLENGDILDVWLPTPGDRDTLADLMRELIRLHHRELHGLIGPGTRASMPGATWDQHLGVLEVMINKTPPGMRFLTAPGLLLSTIAWLQSQMVRLLVVERFSAENPDQAPREYWHNKQYWACLFPQLSDRQRESFTPVANNFRRTFCLSEDECQALWCLQCLRNMLAHGALSPYQISEEDGSPTLIYLPASNGKNNPCCRCPGYPCTTDQGGVIVSFASDRLRTYFEDLRMVGQAVDRAATNLDLKHEDML
ncbi:MAG: hypothetical protein F4X16_08960 [Caldilineaceae bacterium SB0661_bin_34]|nr:hypothetical protein [Caldilineaceae bacterium SB0661_bin_34]